MTVPLLSIRDLQLRFQHKQGLFGLRRTVNAVAGVSLDIAPGEAFGLVGESGCGKSSLARAVLNLSRPSAGQVVFDGRDIASFRPAEWMRFRRRVQYVFQDPLASLDPRMRIVDQVAEVLTIHDIGRREDRQARAYEQLAALGLSAQIAAKYPNALSGGQRQRAVIARSLILGPDLLICDEPLSALDVSVQAQVVNLLVDLRRELGLALFFISHDLSLVRHLCQRVAVMYAGRIVEIGETERIFESPAHPYTRSLLASIPRLEPGGEERDQIPPGDPPSAFESMEGCSFRTRCPFVRPHCALERPVLRPRAQGVGAACHLEEIPG